MKRTTMHVVLVSLLLALAGCFEEYNPTAEQFFKDTMNLDPLPPGISDFKRATQDEPPHTPDKGYFQYRATPSFMAALTKHNKFFMDDPGNWQIQQIQCGEIYYRSSAIWADELSRISMRDKVCYRGFFLPDAHIIIYDPKTEVVDHFYYSIRP